MAQPTFTCSKLAIETLEQKCEICSKLICVFIANFEHILHLCSSASTVNFEHVIAGWDSINSFHNSGNSHNNNKTHTYLLW